MRIVRSNRIVLIGLLVIAALALIPAASGALEPGGSFSDDDGSIHESSIEAIAREAITRGCNPPTNDMFCPDKSVTRAQMATFLTRALDLPPAAGSFLDTDDSVHAANIGALAAAGITRGCNPPTNDMFCPNSAVTRAQMATFLTRALNLTPVDVPPPLPAVSPSPFVVIGQQNWLFFDVTVNQELRSDELIDRTVDELRKIKAIVEASGRQFVYAIPPNKSVIYSDMVPEDVWQASAAQENSDRLRAALDGAADPNRVDLWDVLSGAGEQTYFKHDTHWNHVGALLGARQIAAKAAPGSWSNFGFASTAASQRGDLSDLIGVEWIEEYDDTHPALAGVEPTITDTGDRVDGRPIIISTSPAHAAISPTTTAVLHDSFGPHLYNKLGPLFEEIVYLPSFASPIPDAAHGYLQNSEQIIIEVVERNLPWKLIGVGAAGHLAATLANDFAQTPVPFSREGDEIVVTPGPAVPGGLRYVIVEATVGAPVTIGSEDARIPPSQGAWPPEMVPEASMYGFEIVGEPTTLRLPLPEAVSVTATFVVVVE